MSVCCTRLLHTSSARSHKEPEISLCFTCCDDFSFPLSRWKAHLWPGAWWMGGRGDNSERPALVNNAHCSEFTGLFLFWRRHLVRGMRIHGRVTAAVFPMLTSHLLYELFHVTFCAHTTCSQSARVELSLLFVYLFIPLTPMRQYRTVLGAAFTSSEREPTWKDIKSLFRYVRLLSPNTVCAQTLGFLI